ncbi:MAG: hypothetical protein AB8I08_27030 [Sandaracinaceae bacterium]
MSLLDTLLQHLSPAARRRLAKETAKSAVEQVGARVYEKADAIREDFEQAAENRRAAKAREEAAVQKKADDERDREAIEDELAALKRKLEE